MSLPFGSESQINEWLQSFLCGMFFISTAHAGVGTAAASFAAAST